MTPPVDPAYCPHTLNLLVSPALMRVMDQCLGLSFPPLALEEVEVLEASFFLAMTEVQLSAPPG